VLADLLIVRGVDMGINYGTDRVRFPQPVPVGAKLRGHGELIAAVAVPGAVQTTIRITMQAEGANKPACVADILTRFVGNLG
jgi:acyl dehydratase